MPNPLNSGAGHQHVWSPPRETRGRLVRMCHFCNERQTSAIGSSFPRDPSDGLPNDHQGHEPSAVTKTRRGKAELATASDDWMTEDQRERLRNAITGHTVPAAEAARLFTDAMRGSISAMGALRESVEQVNPSEMFSVYYSPEEVANDFGVSETLKAEITPEEALQVILNDITADMLNGTDAVRERAAHWVTELTAKAARIVKISEGEDDER
jgi:hypothetical protein